MHIGWSLLLIVLAGIALAWLMPDQQSPAVEADRSEAVPRYIVRGAQWQRLDQQGAPIFDAQAETIRYFDDESARLSDVWLYLLDNGERRWQMRAPAGFSAAGQQVLQLHGGVKGEGKWPDGEPLQFESERMRVDVAAKVLETDDPVRLHSASRQASGRGLRLDAKAERIALQQNVEMRYVTP
ncbi:MAG: LPS export ABC transporter periplasmic protein LptC [Panacagrimonas sp.]